MPDDWFVGFHRGLAARFWRAAGATMADDDARLIGELLDAASGAKVLDVPCGDGRIALRLAAAGHEVIGIDLAAGELDHARREAAKAATPASFLVGDLRALPDVGPVDAVVSWGNSFGYLVPADSARSLAAMHDALRPGGRLVLETATVAESLLVGGVKPTASWEFGGVRMTATNRYRSLRAAWRATTSSRTATASSSALGPPTTSTRAASWSACWPAWGSATWPSWAPTPAAPTSSAQAA